MFVLFPPVNKHYGKVFMSQLSSKHFNYHTFYGLWKRKDVKWFKELAHAILANLSTLKYVFISMETQK